MTPNDALAQIIARADPAKAAEMEAYHQTPRRYLGATNPDIDALTKDWRAALTLEVRLQLAADLWET
ncbi:MAG: DNA alkylation repair protein, partial [Paracoccaceae bacterium]|nr:DNA alkylation repair protein [Paracoccaceae bacterium]